MRKKLIILFFVAFNSTANFSGDWINESKSQSFTLILNEKENHLTGKYCFITNNGNRIDCAEDDDENISGIIKDNVALVSFESTFGETGKATLSLKNETLKYEINDDIPFISANMSAPRVIYLKKQELKKEKKM